MNLTHRNIVLGVLAVGLAVPTFLQLRSEVDTFVDIGSIPLMFDGFSSDNVGTIVLGEPKAEQPEPPADPSGNQPAQKNVAYDYLALQRSDKGWRIGQLPGQPAVDLAGAPASTTRVENEVFTHLRAIRSDRETLVQPQATPEQLAEFGLDDEHAFLLRAVDKTGKNVVAELRVGRQAGEGQTGKEAVRGVFVRKGDSNDVVLYEVQQMWRRDVEASNWVDRMIAKIDPEQVRRLSLRNAATGEHTFVFEREAGKASWQCSNKPEGLGALRQSEIDGLVQRCRYLSAQAFERPLSRAGDMQALGLFPPQIELTLTVDEDGQERRIELQVGSKLDDGRNEHYLTCNEVQFLMTWPAGMVTQFELDVAQRLFDPAPDTGK